VPLAGVGRITRPPRATVFGLDRELEQPANSCQTRWTSKLPRSGHSLQCTGAAGCFGLAAATRALAAASGLDVSLDIDITGRHGRALEGAAYFCIAEALTNAAKHARGPVILRVTDRAGSLIFSVTDSGPGFDPGQAVGGAGLQNMGDRVDMLGGAVSVSSRPGSPTTIRGTIPVQVAASSLSGAPLL